MRLGLPTDVKEAEIEAELRKIFPRAEEIRLLFGNQGKFRHKAHMAPAFLRTFDF